MVAVHAAQAYARIGLETGVAAASPQRLIVMLYDGAIKFMNSAAEAMTGWKSEEAKGKTIGTIFRIEMEEEPRTPGGSAQGLQGSHADSTRAVLVNREGRRIPIEYKVVPIEDDWGKIIGTVSIF
jgi:PAS domain S-box-containing protein